MERQQNNEEEDYMVQKFLNLVKEKARLNPARIVFPEIFDQRVLRAIPKILKEKTA